MNAFRKWSSQSKSKPMAVYTLTIVDCNIWMLYIGNSRVAFENMGQIYTLGTFGVIIFKRSRQTLTREHKQSMMTRANKEKRKRTSDSLVRSFYLIASVQFFPLIRIVVICVLRALFSLASYLSSHTQSDNIIIFPLLFLPPAYGFRRCSS